MVRLGWLTPADQLEIRFHTFFHYAKQLPFIICIGTDLVYNTTTSALRKRFFVTFEPDEEVKTIEILVQDDDIVEKKECHYIKLRVPDGETGVNLLQDQANVTVLDNDSE